MNELIKIHTDGQAVTDSLTIAAGAQVEHAAVMKLIRKYLPDFEAFGRVGFEIQPFETAGGTQKREVALLNEDQTTLLFTFLKNTEIARKFKVRLVKAFRSVRDALARAQNKSPAIPQTLPEALRLAADLAEKNQQLIEQAKIDTPKAEWCDRVTAANEHMTITQAAKTLNYPPRKFKDYLRQIGFIYANSDTPMQEHIKAGRVVLRYAHYTTSDGNPVEKPYTHITSKGLKWLYERMVRDGLIEQQQDLFDKTA